MADVDSKGRVILKWMAMDGKVEGQKKRKILWTP